jgi:hypothetical protein
LVVHPEVTVESGALVALPVDSLGGGFFCDVLPSLFSLGFSRRFEVFVGLVRY